MKTLRFAAIAACIIISSQHLHSQTVYWLRAGSSYSWVTGLHTEHYNSRTGYQFGGGIERIISNPIGLKAELLFNKKGFSSHREQHTSQFHRSWINEVDQIALSLPVLSTLYFKKAHLEYGLYLDYLVKTSQLVQESRTSLTGEEQFFNEIKDRDTFKNPELGFIFGGSLELFQGVFASVRFVQGFSHLGLDYPWIRNRAMQFSLTKRIGGDFTPAPVAFLSPQGEGSTKSSYLVLGQQNVNRVAFNRLFDGSEVVLRWLGAESGMLQITDISVVHSSGHQTPTGYEVRINDATFPINIRIRYTVRNTLSGNTYNSQLDMVVNEAGAWNVTIHNN